MIAIKKNILILSFAVMSFIIFTSCSGTPYVNNKSSIISSEENITPNSSDNQSNNTKSEISSENTNESSQASEPEPEDEIKSLKFICMGDNIFHLPVINSGLQQDGSYKFDHLYENFKDDIANADISVINQETMLGGSEFPYSEYPLFNSPHGVGETLVNVGFDVILHATNHTMDMGYKGFLNTIDFWDKYPNVNVLGLNRTPEDQNKITVVERNGIKIALLNYTQHLNGLKMPDDKTYIVNLMDKELMERHIKEARQMADFVVVFPHWGTEYIYTPDSYQVHMAEFFTEQKVDLVIGTHPHVLETIEWVEGKDGHRTLVYYSLGNFVSTQDRIPRMLGGMAEVEFEIDGDDKKIKKAWITPVVTHFEGGGGAPWNYGVYKLSEYTDELAAKHGVKRNDKVLTVAALNDLANSIVGDWIIDD